MKEKIANTIALHQMTINELKEIKRNIDDSIEDSVKLKLSIETRHIIGFDVGIYKRKKILSISNYTMNLLLDEAIKKEKERIDKLIDMEIERKLSIIDTTKEKPVIDTKDNDLCIQFIKDYLNKTDEPNCFFQTLYEKCEIYCKEHNSEMISRKRLSLCLKELGCVIKSKKNSDNVPYRYVWFDNIII